MARTLTQIRCVQNPQHGRAHASGLCHLRTISTYAHTYVGLTISPAHKNTRCMSEYFNKAHHVNDIRMHTQRTCTLSCSQSMPVSPFCPLCAHSGAATAIPVSGSESPALADSGSAGTEENTGRQRASTHKSEIHLCGETAMEIPFFPYQASAATRPSMHRPRRPFLVDRKRKFRGTH